MRALQWMWILGGILLSSVAWPNDWIVEREGGVTHIYSSPWAKEVDERLREVARTEFLAKNETLAQIIALGRQLWDIIAENASEFQPGEEVPAVHILPTGTQTWEALHSWTEAPTRAIETQILDLLGGPMMTARYLPVFDCNGRRGREPGRYISNASIMLTTFNISGVGLTYSSGVRVREARNIGTAAAPIASVLFELHHKAETLIEDARRIDLIRMMGSCDFSIHQESDQW